MKTSFEKVKDSRNVREFLSKLRHTSMIAVNVVFIAAIDYYDVYSGVRKFSSVMKLRKSVDDGGAFALATWHSQDLREYITISSESPEKTAMQYVYFVDEMYDVDTAVIWLEKVLFLDDEDILPYLKLALAYCEWTNS